MELRFAKVGGKTLLFETAYQRRTPASRSTTSAFFVRPISRPGPTGPTSPSGHPIRSSGNCAGTSTTGNTGPSRDFPPSALSIPTCTPSSRATGGCIWEARWGRWARRYCDRCARGGPAIRQDTYIAPWAGYEGDDRKKIIPFFWVNYFRGDGGRSESINLQPELDFKISSRFTTSLSAFWESNTNDSQYFDTVHRLCRGLHYTFAHLDQSTLSFTWRLGYTFTPNTSLQVYASPFISKGTYKNLRELDQPRAEAYDDRYKPYHRSGSGRLQFPAVPVQRGVPVGVPAWFDAIRGMESGQGRAGLTSPKVTTPSGATCRISSTSGRTIRSW